MNSLELTYLISGGFTATAGMVMLAVYSLSTSWWRSHTGRMLVTYAVAETGMSTIFALAVSLHINPVWFRVVWVGLQVTVGLALWYQTAMIVILNRSEKEKEGEPV